MAVAWFMEYDIPKEEKANKEYMKYIFDEEYSCMVMNRCKKLGAKLNVWTDGLHHIVMTIEFKKLEDHAKLFGEAEWREGLWKLDRLVLNSRTRLMWPAGQ